MKTKCIDSNKAGKAAESRSVLGNDHGNDVVNMNRCPIRGRIIIPEMRRVGALQISGFLSYIVILLLVLRFIFGISNAP